MIGPDQQGWYDMIRSDQQRQMGKINDIIDYQQNYYMRKQKDHETGIRKLNLINTLLDRKYSIYRKIGEGRNSIVYAAVNQQDKKEYVVKFYNLGVLEDQEKIQQMRSRLFSEFLMHKKLTAQNFIKSYDFYDSPKYLAVVYELLPPFTLADQIQKSKLPVQDCKDILKQLVISLEELLGKGLYIKQLNPANIFIKNGIYKIKDLSPNEHYDSLEAPQTQKALPKSKQQRQKVSIWALGCLYLQMRIHSNNLFQKAYSENKESESQQVFTKQFQMKIPQKLFADQIKFLTQTLQKKQQNRIQWADLISHNILDQTNIELSTHYIINSVYETTYESQEINLQEQEIEKKRFSFKKLTPSDIQICIQRIDREEQQNYKILQNFYFETLKTEFILNNIINPIYESQLLDLSKREHVELMYLFSSRCFFDLSFINNKLEQFKKVEARKKFEEKIHQIYQKCNKNLDKYSCLLTKKENKMSSIASDWVNKLRKGEQKKMKDRILSGLEGLDFTRKEQIDFTCDFLKEKKIIASIQNKKKKSSNISNFLRNYQHICDLKQKDAIESTVKGIYSLKQCIIDKILGGKSDS